MSKLVVQRHFVLKHGEYKPEAQASESAQLIHSLALRACTVLPGGAVQLSIVKYSQLNPRERGAIVSTRFTVGKPDAIVYQLILTNLIPS